MSYRYVSVVREKIKHDDLDTDEQFQIRVLLGKETDKEYKGFADIDDDGIHEVVRIQQTVLDRYDHGSQIANDELKKIGRDKFHPDDYTTVPASAYNGGDSV